MSRTLRRLLACHQTNIAGALARIWHEKHSLHAISGLGLVIVLAGLQACAPTEANKMVGHWVGTDGAGKSLDINFTRERELRLFQGGKVMKGRWKAVSCCCPLEVNLYVQISPSYTRLIPMIVRYTDEGYLQFRVSDGLKYRPTKFMESATPNQYTLERKRS